ncbi:unnamed protein product [Urochloa humidicola]
MIDEDRGEDGVTQLKEVSVLSIDSSSKMADLEWVPEGMDSSSACRIGLHIPDYVEICDGGRQLHHKMRDVQLVVDRDTTNFKDLSDDISLEVKHGTNEGMNLTYWDKDIFAYSTLTSDSNLMAALDMYWDIRMLPLLVTIYDTMPLGNSEQLASHSTEQVMHLVSSDVPSGIVAESGSVDLTCGMVKPKKTKKGKKIEDDDEPWVDDEEEYVGLNDEAPYLADVVAPHNLENEASDSEYSVEDELVVDDEAGCDVLEHVTNLENPTLAIGMTFEDGDTFKKAIRQYAVLNEFEIAAPYSESTRYRGHCKGTKSKGKKCKWRIHVSMLQDGKTWQIKRLYEKHTCASTAKVD